MNRRIASSVAWLAVPFLLAACGGKKGGGSGPAANPPPPGEEPAPPPATSTSTGTEAPTTGEEDPKKDDPPAKSADLFKPKHTPGAFALAMPGALSLDLGASLRLQDEELTAEDAVKEAYPDVEEAPAVEGPSDNQSHGIAELNYQVESIERHVQQYSRELSTLDVVLEDNASDCFDSDGCDITDAKGVFTQEMANKVVDDLGGPGLLTKDEIDAIDQLVGGEISIGNVSVRPSADAAYTWVVTLDDGAGRTLTASWLEVEDDGAKTYPSVSLAEKSKGSWVDEADGTTHSYSVDYKLQYNATQGSMSVADKSDYDGHVYNNSFYFLVDKESQSDGASFAVDISTDGPAGDGNVVKISGYADNGGAYLQTLYAFDDFANTLTLSGAPEGDKSYDIFPVGTVANGLSMENAWQLSLGSFYVASGDESTTVPNAFYMGPVGDEFPEAGLPLIAVVYDGATGEPTYADAGINVTAVTQEATRSVAGYTETFTTTDGQIDGSVEFCYYDFPDTTLEWPETLPEGICSSGWTGEGQYVDTFTSEVGSDGLAKLGQIQVGLGGAIAWADFDGAALYFISAEDPAAAIAAINAAWASEDADDDLGAWEKIVGMGEFIGLKGEDYSEVSINDIYVYSPWASAEVLSAAKVAKLVFDPETGATKLELIDAAEIVAVEITESNADVPFEDVIADEAPAP